MKRFENIGYLPPLFKKPERKQWELSCTRPVQEVSLLIFTYPDVNGKQVSLSDFKGKVVLIGCLGNLVRLPGRDPHLKKLEEEMKGMDVIFLGVSVDEAPEINKNG